MAATGKKLERYVQALATAARYDGDAVKIEIVLQPQDASGLLEMIARALIPETHARK